MITFVKAFKTEDGKTHATIEEAQRYEIASMLLEARPISVATSGDQQYSDVAQWMVENSTKIVDVLTTKPTSKPRARSINGGRKLRVSKSPTAKMEAA